FLFNMSHDIRTPMNAIVGYTELILKNIEDKERCIDYVQKIKSSSELLVSIINNVLEMARIESNKTSLNETATRAGHISDEVCAIYTELMKEKNIEFVHSYDVEPEFIYVDRVKTREILLNLISNAYKYTHSGGKVSVSFKGIPSEKEGYINIRTVVSDTGVGMSESFLPKIFEEFSRDDSAVANQIQGTGLGMPIVKKFTELMGGTISVKSELGKGTEFVLEIPHRIAKGDSLPEAEIEIDDSVFRGKRVLLAEDNELNAEISTVILEDMGFKVERAENGQIAVNMVADHPDNYYDIVLMDIQMPIMSGYDATKQIRAMSDIKKAYVPIVAMTANAFEEDRRRSLQNGMDAHIAKPLQLNVLRKTLAFIFARDNLDESYTLRWKNRFADCEGIMSFEQEYRAKGKKIGWLIYEAYGKEKIRFADKNLIEICGCHEYYEFLEYVNGSFKTLVHPDDIERVEKEIETQISTSDSCMDRVRYRIICKDGVTRTIDDIGHKAFVEDGMPVFYVAIVDVTE
ncbi:MAG: ATP-binding protein, partial [Clostridia bacterium]|nr:ATP-binding protein [Clostridia bacterium]